MARQAASRHPCVQQVRVRPPEAGGAGRRPALQAVPVTRRNCIFTATGAVRLAPPSLCGDGKPLPTPHPRGALRHERDCPEFPPPPVRQPPQPGCCIPRTMTRRSLFGRPPPPAPPVPPPATEPQIETAPAARPGSSESPFSIREISARVRAVLEDGFPRNFWIEGELSQVGRPQSGHLYLTFREERAVLEAVAWASDAQGFAFAPERGRPRPRVRTASHLRRQERLSVSGPAPREGRDRRAAAGTAGTGGPPRTRRAVRSGTKA